MIKKRKLIDGVYYIEIPEVGLYIQCGVPAECIKHLKKHNIINEKSKNGVSYETGPNAILLCDTMIQNGEFSNLSEFLVLHMLYKQGLIIPNHPNNNGQKPLLIGNETQIASQMQYIYRGNYGLVSKEEIMSCGIQSDFADELYRLKLKFAFGKLQSATELLDSCVLGNESKEIRDGVFIKRTKLNTFEISYKHEHVEVDLNLPKGIGYSAPYHLPLYKAKKNYFSIIHSGQGDGWDIDRSSFNSIISFHGRFYLVDMVPNVKYILDALSVSINDIEGVFFTHCHDDHLAGITTLLRCDRKIKIYCAKLVKLTLIKKLSALLDTGESEIINLLDFHELELDQWNDINELEVKPEISPHPVETTVLVFRTYDIDGYKSYGHFADIVDLNVLKNMITDDPLAPGISQEFFDKIKKRYMEKFDLKAIDVGGGMIHGNALDFKEDSSSRIVLAHYDGELKQSEKDVGIEEKFGSSSILIDSKQNYDNRMVYKYLLSNFSLSNNRQIEAFFNFDIIDFEPGNVIAEANTKVEYLFLIINGIVEKINKKTGKHVYLESAAIISEKAVVQNIHTDSEFRSKSYVRALKIPASYFLYFIEKNHYKNDYLKKFDLGAGFLENDLFSESISYTTLNRLLKNMNKHAFNTTCSLVENKRVYLVLEGRVNYMVNKQVIDTIEKGGFFGGISDVLNAPSIYTYEIIANTKLYSIPTNIVQDIPIAFWKMLERYVITQKKLINYSVYDSNLNTFLWNSSYTINIAEMDFEHKKQLSYIDEINTYALEEQDFQKILGILDGLYQYSQQHFKEEEELMAKYGYGDLEEHKELHFVLLNKMKVYVEELRKGNLDISYLAITLKEWLLQHILEEDIKYSRFLNQRGVF